MRIKIDDLIVYFPFKAVYKEQFEYMTELKRILDGKGHGILEMPTGTGKTVCLLSLIISYQLAYPDSYKKLYYCTRTIGEMEKTLAEQKVLIDKILVEIQVDSLDMPVPAVQKEDGEATMDLEDNTIRFQGSQKKKSQKIKKTQKLLAIGLSSRINLCIHSEVSENDTREKVDAGCRQRTANFVRQEFKGVEDQRLCQYFENIEDLITPLENQIEPGVYTLEDMKVMGRKLGLCPYFTARRLQEHANIVVFSYQYLQDPKVSGLVMSEANKDALVVFDEAHNIDDACIENHTIRINKGSMQRARNSIERISKKIQNKTEANMESLDNAYQDLVKGLGQQQMDNDGKIYHKHNKDYLDRNSDLENMRLNIGKSVMEGAMPGNLRKSSDFQNFLKRALHFMDVTYLRKKEVIIENTKAFQDGLKLGAHCDETAQKFIDRRLHILLQTMQITDSEEISTQLLMSHFLTLVSSQQEGFKIIQEPYSDNSSIPDPTQQFVCLDSRIAFQPVVENFKSVIQTSGTMSPMEIYPKILGFQPMVMKSFNINLPINTINPIIVSRSIDQLNLSSEYAERSNTAVIKNYGHFLVDVAKNTPDGIVVFFPSYFFMEEVVLQWKQFGVIEKLLEYKLLFIETKSVEDTSKALTNYRAACDVGRGAVFLSVARGKVAEGIDFHGHYGRAVMMIGVPFQYTFCRQLLCRIDFLQKNFGITKEEFFVFDAVRQCCQCLGRVIRSKADYGIMILADRRWSSAMKYSKFPLWIKSQLKPSNTNQQTDQALNEIKTYFKNMGQLTDLSNYPRELYYLQEDFQNV